MSRLFEMGGYLTGGGIALFILIFVVFIGGAVLVIRWRAKRDKRPKGKQTQDIPAGGETEDKPEDKKEDKLGEYPAYIIRKGGAFDFDYINTPTGEVFIADTSMPKGGACYLVKEADTAGQYEAYDPRTAPIISDETPVKAWFATHWGIVREVYASTAPWWKSTSLWIAGITGVAAFIVVLATVGG